MSSKGKKNSTKARSKPITPPQKSIQTKKSGQSPVVNNVKKTLPVSKPIALARGVQPWILIPVSIIVALVIYALWFYFSNPTPTPNTTSTSTSTSTTITPSGPTQKPVLRIKSVSVLTIVLEWDAVEDANLYQIENLQTSTSQEVDTLQVTFDSLTPDTTYTFRCTAKNAIGSGPVGDNFQAKTNATGQVNKVAAQEITGTRLKLVWDLFDGADNYKIIKIIILCLPWSFSNSPLWPQTFT